MPGPAAHHPQQPAIFALGKFQQWFADQLSFTGRTPAVGTVQVQPFEAGTAVR